MKRRALYISIVLIIVVGFAVYGNTINGKFIWDDHHLIKDNIYIKSWSNISHIFTRHIGAGGVTKYNSFRPLQMVTYMVNYSLGGLDVRGYHVTNIFLHIFASLAIFWFINLLYNDRSISLIASLLFIVHPIHVAVVAYISGRADSMALLFMLLSFVFYIKNLKTRTNGIYILMLISYVLALLSRESVLILPALLLLYHYTFKKRFDPYRFFSVFGIAVIYILMRLTALRSLLPHTEINTTVFQRLPGFFIAVANYMRLMVFPFDQHMEYGNRLFSFMNPVSILGALILFSLLLYALRKRNKNRIVFFSICWFFAALMPLSNIYPIPIAYMAEHWLYVPSIGFFIIVAKGLSGLYKTKTHKDIAIVLIVAILIFYSIVTFRYNKTWSDPMVFYTRNLEYVPDSVRTLSCIAVEHYNRGNMKEAIKALEKAIEINPKDSKAHNNLGRIYSDLGLPREAIASYGEAIKLDPDLIVTYSNLAIAYIEIGEKKKARALFEKAIEIDPGFAGGYFNLAIFYYKEKRYDLAIQYCDKAIKRGYNVSPSFLNNLKPYRKSHPLNQD